MITGIVTVILLYHLVIKKKKNKLFNYSRDYLVTTVLLAGPCSKSFYSRLCS